MRLTHSGVFDFKHKPCLQNTTFNVIMQSHRTRTWHLSAKDSIIYCRGERNFELKFQQFLFWIKFYDSNLKRLMT